MRTCSPAVTVLPMATVSIMPRIASAIAPASMASACSSVSTGAAGDNNSAPGAGSAPICCTRPSCQPIRYTTTAVATTASSGPGRCCQSHLPPMITPSATPPSTSACQLTCPINGPSCIATPGTPGRGRAASPVSMPRNAATWPAPISTPAPAVKPTITDWLT